jgi:hypothetical protein
MLTCVMMTVPITQFVSLMRLLNFFLSAFFTHKLCSHLYFLLQVKNPKHDTCVQGHYLQLVVSLIKIQSSFVLYCVMMETVSYRNVASLF